MKRSLMIIASVAMTAGLTRATTLYSNGFEPTDPGTADFYDSTTGVQGANITVVPSGGGTLHLTAPQGSNYAEITNVDNAYQAAGADGVGYGQSVYTDYGYARNGGTFDPITGQPTGPGIASNSFFESTAYYIDTNWAAASADNNYEGFWVDTTPYSDSSYSDETNFRVIDNGSGTIVIEMVGLNGTSTADITASGWYTFKTTFQDNGGFVANTLSVIDASGNTVGSLTQTSDMPFADLEGTNYGDWTTVWQNGFANDTLGIDDVEVGSLAMVPLPASAWSGLALLGGLAAVGGIKRIRKQVT